jgi:hypothetical protein
MKYTITLFGLLLLSFMSLAQITIKSTDVPVPTATFNFDDISLTNPSAPTAGPNQNWNYSSYFGNNPFTIDYFAETDPFYTATGIDVYVQGFKNLTPNLGYVVYNEYDFNSNGVFDSGLNVPYQAYSLAAFTGNNADSLVFPLQDYLVNSPRVLMHFPFTANSSWKSSSPRISNFNLTLTALGFTHVPGQHRYNLVRNDSIVGWGKLSVYTPTGPSIRYDVLMDKIEQYATDSFFLNGVPAPALFLNSFGVTQGQHTGDQYSYNFYRKGTYAYLMRIFYASDKTYTTINAAYENSDDLLTGVNNASAISYSSLVFPNPSNGGEINIKLIGKNISTATYTIADLSGRTVQQGLVTMQGGGLMQVRLNSQLANGNYFIMVNDEMLKEVVKEEISVQR